MLQVVAKDVGAVIFLNTYLVCLWQQGIFSPLFTTGTDTVAGSTLLRSSTTWIELLTMPIQQE